MSSLRKIVSGAGLLTLSEGVVQICTLLRNIVVVRALSQHQYGIASTFTVVVTMVVGATSMRLDRLLVSAKDGSEPTFQRVVQTITFFQGGVQALALFTLAPWLCTLFNVQDAQWQYRALALVPLLSCLQHLDTERFQRELRFTPTAVASVVPEILALLFVLALVHYVHDYTVVLWVAIARAFLFALVTHLTAERRYGWSLDRGYTGKALRFGWPLLANGTLMILVSQGDRFLIGSSESIPALVQRWGIPVDNLSVYDKTQLAIYSVAVTVTAMPAILIDKVWPRIFLPLISRSKDDPNALAKSYSLGMSLIAPVSAAIAGFFVLLGDTAVTIFYSDRYGSVRAIIGLLGLACAVRILRIALVTVALSMGDAKLVLYGNVTRSVALFGFAYVILFGRPLEWVAVVLIASEVLALAVVTLRLKTDWSLPAGASLSALFFVAATSTAPFLAVRANWVDGGLEGLIAMVVYGLALIALALLTFGELRAQALRFARR